MTEKLINTVMFFLYRPAPPVRKSPLKGPGKRILLDNIANFN